jgi:hypothetical protein
MGVRFQKRIRIFKGLTLNLSKSGTSWTVGRSVASVNLRRDKVTGTVGIPSTGLSYRQWLDDPGTANMLEHLLMEFCRTNDTKASPPSAAISKLEALNQGRSWNS